MSSAKIVLSFRPSGTSWRTIRCARPSNAGVADEHGVVLRLARQDLDDAADLGVAPDDRVQPARARLGDEVAAVLLQRLVGRLGHRARHALGAAHLGQHLEEAVRRQPAILEHLAGGRARAQHRQDEVLDGDVLVLQARGLLLGVLERQREPARDAHVTARARPRHARPRLERLRDVGADRVDVDAGALEQARDQAVGLVEQREQQVLDVELGVTEAHRLGLRVVDGLLGLLGQTVDVHSGSSGELRVGSERRELPLEDFDAGEQLARQDGARVADAEVASQPGGARESGSVAAREQRRRGGSAGGLDEPERDEAPHELGVQAGLARQRVEREQRSGHARTDDERERRLRAPALWGHGHQLAALGSNFDTLLSCSNRSRSLRVSFLGTLIETTA
jgi:hypothetical protein